MMVHIHWERQWRRDEKPTLLSVETAPGPFENPHEAHVPFSTRDDDGAVEWSDFVTAVNVLDEAMNRLMEKTNAQKD